MKTTESVQATASLERGSKPVAGIDVPADKVLQRKDLQSRLQDLLKPYVCSMSQVDIIFGHEGTGKSEQVKQACRHLDGGTLYLDLQGSSRLGSHILTALTGERSRGLFQSFRDLLRGQYTLDKESYSTQVLCARLRSVGPMQHAFQEQH